MFISDDVIDNSSTWGGEYPLGAAYFNDSAHPLTLHSVIRSCSANRSAAEAIQLIQILDSNKLIPTLIQEVYKDLVPASQTINYYYYYSVNILKI